MRHTLGWHRCALARLAPKAGVRVACLAVLACGLWPVGASAAPPAPKVAEDTPYPGDPVAGFHWTRGWVVRIVDADAVIDLGTADGLRFGQEMGVYRTFKAKHPRTGKEVTDRFFVGVTPVVELATHLAVLRPAKEMLALLHEGDLVECQAAEPTAAEKVAVEPAPLALKAHGKGKLAKPKDQPADAAKTGTVDERLPECPKVECPACPRVAPVEQPSQPADEASLDETFRNCTDRTPIERIAMWEKWLRRFPASRFVTAVRDQIRTLQDLIAGSSMARDDSERLARLRAEAQRVYHDRPARQRIGEAVWLVFTAADWSQVADLRVHLRATGETTYRMLRPTPSGRLHLRLRVPDELVREPGFEYFVEMTLVSDKAQADLIGGPREPVQVAVSDPFAVVGRQPIDASTFRMTGEFVDFNRLRGDDQFLYSEMSFAYRLQESPILYAVEMGYGLISGVGGPVATGSTLLADGSLSLHTNGPKAGQPIIKDDTINPRSAAFKYGYLQTEWALAEVFHAVTRLVIGLGASGIDTGVELMGRVGRERGTNLRVGVSTMADTGRALSVALTTVALPQVPITGLVEVTNRPVGEDIGVRLVGQADFKLSRHFGITARLGYNVRTIVHAGFGAGGGMVVTW